MNYLSKKLLRLIEDYIEDEGRYSFSWLRRSTTDTIKCSIHSTQYTSVLVNEWDVILSNIRRGRLNNQRLRGILEMFLINYVDCYTK